MTKTFEINDEHIKLLRASCFTWNNCEFGALMVDPKRPYGNSNVIIDLRSILGDDLTDEYLLKLHEETLIALEIFISTGTMQIGTYKLGSDWEWEKIN